MAFPCWDLSSSRQKQVSVLCRIMSTADAHGVLVFDRAAALEIDQGHSIKEAQQYEEKEEHQAEETVPADKPTQHVPHELESGVAGLHPPAKTFKEELKPWSGYKSQQSLLVCFLRPFPLFFVPTVLWGFLTYGIATLLLVLMSLVPATFECRPSY